VWVEALHRNPDSEEPEAPLVEARIPDGCLVVAPVVDGTTPPLATGRGERPTPGRTRWRTQSPRRGTVAPGRPVEVATVRVSVPSAITRGATGSAGSTAGVSRQGSAVTTGSTYWCSATACAWIAGGGAVRCAARTRSALPGCGKRRADPRAQCRCTQSAGDGRSCNQLPQFHCASPSTRQCLA
jgi:hypothetical protein